MALNKVKEYIELIKSGLLSANEVRDQLELPIYSWLNLGPVNSSPMRIEHQMTFDEIDRLVGSKNDDSPLVPVLRAKGMPISMGFNAKGHYTAIPENGTFRWVDNGFRRTFIWEGNQSLIPPPIPHVPIPNSAIINLTTSSAITNLSTSSPIKWSIPVPDWVENALRKNVRETIVNRRDYNDESKRSITFDDNDEEHD